MWSNHLSLAGAETLALRIKNYWADRGYAVDTWTERTRADDLPDCVGKGYLYGVRSNLINGAPRGGGRCDTWKYSRK